MKKLIVLISSYILLLTLGVGFAQEAKSAITARSLGLLGSIYTVAETRISGVGKTAMSSPIIATYTFTASGFLQEQAAFNNDIQQVITQTVYTYTPDNDIAETITRVEGTIISDENSYFENGLWTHTYVTDGAGNPSYTVIRDGYNKTVLGELTTPFTVYILDAQNRPVTAQYFSGQNSKPTSFTQWTYTAQGQLASSFNERSDGVDQDRVVYTYNPVGQLIELRTTNKNDQLNGRTVYTYDNQSNPVTEDLFDAQGQLQLHLEYVYTYDLSNNWIKKETYQTFSPDAPSELQGTSIRTLTYY
jgi:antitoxin component YwqK of YwqJK toxin-antitoxin module